MLFESVAIDSDYSRRSGLDERFLGTPIGMPKLTRSQRLACARNRQPLPRDSSDPYLFRYYNFSLYMHRDRRIALCTGVSVNGDLRPDLGEREGDSWAQDPRLEGQVIPESFYERNPFDRGHLVRRLDAAWGATYEAAKLANDDTFHLTNCSPQHEKFNRNKSTWHGLERFILGTAVAKESKIVVFNGPILRDSDPIFLGNQVPLEYWKILCYRRRTTGELAAAAFIVSQARLVRRFLASREADEEFDPDDFQVPIARIIEETKLDFHGLAPFDRSADLYREVALDEVGQQRESFEAGVDSVPYPDAIRVPTPSSARL